MVDKANKKMGAAKQYLTDIVVDRLIKWRNNITRLNKYRIPVIKKSKFLGLPLPGLSDKRFHFKRRTPPREKKHPIEEEIEFIFAYNKTVLNDLWKIEKYFMEIDGLKKQMEAIYGPVTTKGVVENTGKPVLGPYKTLEIINQEKKYYKGGTGFDREEIEVTNSDGTKGKLIFLKPKIQVIVTPDGEIEKLCCVGFDNEQDILAPLRAYLKYLKDTKGKKIGIKEEEVAEPWIQLVQHRIDAISEIVKREKEYFDFLDTIGGKYADINRIILEAVSKKSPASQGYVIYDHHYFFVKPFIVLEKDSDEFEKLNPPTEAIEEIKDDLLKDEKGNYRFVKVKPLKVKGKLLEVRGNEEGPGLDENGMIFETDVEGNVLMDEFRNKEADYKREYITIKKVKVRKVHPKFITKDEHGNRTAYFLEIMNWINNEWDTTRDDLRDGRYHLFSRGIIDYQLASAKYDIVARKINDAGDRRVTKEYEMKLRKNNVVIKTEKGYRNPSDKVPAFDMKAFDTKKYPFKHLGRKYYYEMPNSSIFAEIVKAEAKYREIRNKGRSEKEAIEEALKVADVDPHPTLSTRGLAKYIIDRVLGDAKNFKEAISILHKLEPGLDYGRRDVMEPFNNMAEGNEPPLYQVDV